MHILIIPSSYFMTENSPVGGIFQFEQAKALSNQGYKIGILGIHFPSKNKKKEIGSSKLYEKINNINIYRFYDELNLFQRLQRKILSILDFIFKRKGETLCSKYIYNRITKRYFKRYISKHGKPDIAHAHGILNAGGLALKLRKWFGVPYIITEHSTAFAAGLIPEDIDNELKENCRNAKICTCVSSEFKKILERRLNIPFSILHNIVDDIFFQEPLLKKKSNRFRFINVALMHSKKNQELLLNAFYDGFKDKDAELVIIGNGPLMEKLKGLSIELNIKEQVSFLGILDRIGVRDELLKSNCFVLSSTYETFGVVLIEALACGLPLISTKSGGPEDIVNETNGILVEVKDQRALSEAMVDVYSQREKYDPSKLRDEAKNKYGEMAFIENLVALYK